MAQHLLARRGIALHTLMSVLATSQGTVPRDHGTCQGWTLNFWSVACRYTTRSGGDYHGNECMRQVIIRSPSLPFPLSFSATRRGHV